MNTDNTGNTVQEYVRSELVLRLTDGEVPSTRYRDMYDIAIQLYDDIRTVHPAIRTDVLSVSVLNRMNIADHDTLYHVPTHVNLRVIQSRYIDDGSTLVERYFIRVLFCLYADSKWHYEEFFTKVHEIYVHCSMEQYFIQNVLPKFKEIYSWMFQ